MSILLNIHGYDVVTVMKAVQVSPWMWTYDCDIGIKSNGHAVAIYHNCPTPWDLEKEGKGHEKLICQEMGTKAHGHHGPFLQPEYQGRCVKSTSQKG